MQALFIGVGEVGSPTDVATLLVCLIGFYRLSDSQDLGHAATVALAECVPRVDADHVRADLDVPERASAQYLDAPVRADGGRLLEDFPAEDEPDGDVSAPHHFYIGVVLSTFAFVSVWDLYPVTGAAMVLLGLAVALDDALSHAFGIPTPLDLFWKRALYPAIRRVER